MVQSTPLPLPPLSHPLLDAIGLRETDDEVCVRGVARGR